MVKDWDRRAQHPEKTFRGLGPEKPPSFQAKPGPPAWRADSVTTRLSGRQGMYLYGRKFTIIMYRRLLK